MAARNVFRVIPNGKSWSIVKNGDVLSTHVILEKALRKARMLADRTISSQILVYRPDGSMYKPH